MEMATYLQRNSIMNDDKMMTMQYDPVACKLLFGRQPATAVDAKRFSE